MQVKLKYLLFVLFILSMIAFMGCRVGEDGYTPPVRPLEISGITPGEVLSHTSFVLNVTGQGFNENSVIVFNEQPVETNYVNTQMLNAAIDADRTAFSPDLFKVDIPVWVINRDGASGATLAESAHLSLTVWPMPEFSDPIPVYQIPSEVTGISYFQLVVDESNRFFLTWRETTRSPDYVPSYASKLCMSTDGGSTWGAPLDIPTAKTFFSRDGGLYLFPHDEAMEDGQLKFYRSGDNGLTWNTESIADLRPEHTFNGYRVCMDGTGRFILVYAQTNKYDRVRLTTLHSSDSGRTWEMKGESFSSYSPDDDNYAYGYHLDWMVVNDTGGVVLGAVYDSVMPVAISRVYRSSDGGDTFEECTVGLADRNILSFGGGYLTPDGKLYAAYEDNYSYRVYQLAFFRGGGLSEQTENLHFLDNRYSMGNMVMDTDGNMYVSWSIFISRSINGGDEWSTPMELAPGYFGWNSAAFDNKQNLHIARLTDEYNIILIRSGGT